MEKSKKTILLTGAAGFIGSNVLMYFFEKYPTYHFIVLDALTYAGKLEHIPEVIRNSKRFTFVHGDVQDEELVHKLVGRSNVVVHFAAETHVEHSIFDNIRFFETDVLGTLSVANAVLAYGKTVDRFIHISTCEVYGSGMTEYMDEQHLLNPQSPYAAAKAGADRLVYAYFMTYGLPGIILRPFNIIGPRQHVEKVTPQFITSCLLGKELTVHGHGKSGRDYLYVSDVADAIDRLIHAPREKVAQQIFNIGSGKATSVLALAKEVVRQMGYSPSKITFVEDRPGQVTSFSCDYSKAKTLLGWEPKVSFEEGVRQTIAWYKDHPHMWQDQIDTVKDIQDTPKTYHHKRTTGETEHPHKRIKVLYGINRLTIGGAERLMLSQLNAMDRTQFDPHLVTLLPSVEPNFNALAEHLGDKWKKFSFAGLFDVFSWWELYSYVRREKFDVVITNLFLTNFLLRSAAIAARVPIIISSELNIYTKRSPLWIWAEQLLAPYTHKIIANSKLVLEAASKQLNIPKEKFMLNYSTVDTHEIRPATKKERTSARAAYHIPPEAFVIVNAGRLVEQKGQRYLIDAFTALKQSGAESAVLFIFGEGARRPELEAQARASGFEKDIHLPGAVPIQDVIGVADVFVLPSLWEGMPLILLEAMAGGLPVVASDVGGCSEVVSSENGFLVPPKDVRALTQKLEVLMKDQTLCTRLGTSSRKEVEKFSVENNLKNLYETIRSARNKKSHTHATK